jgi:atypical dual specificity phosphatase
MRAAIAIALLACNDPIAPEAPMPTAPAEAATPEPPVAATPSIVAAQATPRNFSWIEPGVGGMAHPGTGERLDAVLGWLEAQDVTLVVSLTETAPISAELAARHHLRTLHLPITDFTPPSLEQQASFVAAVGAARARGERVVVHCGAGLGRTGTMLASWLVDRGLDADPAIARVRELRPGSIETSAQEAAVRAFAARPR